LNADHHGAAKFANVLDSNYIIIRNVLKWVIGEVFKNGKI
jgi:hypothetical protein